MALLCLDGFINALEAYAEIITIYGRTGNAATEIEILLAPGNTEIFSL